MKTSDFDYELPQELIAQTPTEPRDHSRLLVYNRATGEIQHRHFYDVIDYLNPGDALVINHTKVIPARLLGNKQDTGGKMEFLLLKRLEGDLWEVLAKPARRAQVGTQFVFGDSDLTGQVEGCFQDGIRHVRFFYEGVFEDAINRAGIMPLPPYIHERLKDANRYQTVYSDVSGSAAAPTAGLHFTPQLLDKLQEKGVKIIRVLLHVGLGTFRPVNTENIQEHVMHQEHYELDAQAARELNAIRANGGRIIAVGTTSTRVLETVADENRHFEPQMGETGIFIYPSYTFKGIDAQITNFHLPKSTLLMMISAFAGREEILKVYEEAVKEQYRFFSFGDAMLIL